MSLVFRLFWAVTIVELLLWLVPSLKWRRFIAPLVLLSVSLSSIAIFISHLSLPTALILLLSIYRLCNLLRCIKARINEKYLQRLSIQTSLSLIGLQALVLLAWQITRWLQITTYHLWLLLLYGTLIGSLVLLSSTIRHLIKTRPPRVSSDSRADRDLPTLTVAIPARNETGDLEACLSSLIASTYPKLEIIVLDDCSQNRRTPEIIRSFAHNGVRFIQGAEPQESWLAKNQAYQRLMEESNGELLLFCGVDVRFQPDSLRQLVLVMLHKHKSMVSVLPNNRLSPTNPTSSILVQPMRYAWELALPRKLLRWPPVLSTCWLIKREVLAGAGGFAAVSRSIIPEGYFARVSAASDGYSFMQSSAVIAISSTKRLSEQEATAIRVRYPQVHKRLELVAIVTILELIILVLPYILLLLFIIGHFTLLLSLVSLTVAVILSVVYLSIVRVVYQTWLLRSAVLFPIAAMLDVLLLNYSMQRYEFFGVEWKDRDICVPVMGFNDTSLSPNPLGQKTG